MASELPRPSLLALGPPGRPRVYGAGALRIAIHRSMDFIRAEKAQSHTDSILVFLTRRRSADVHLRTVAPRSRHHPGTGAGAGGLCTKPRPDLSSSRC